MLVEIRKMGKVERAAVTSLDVAATFGKEHKHVMRDIRELGCSAEFNESNFGLIEYTGHLPCGGCGLKYPAEQHEEADCVND